jgi:hypothetical protein
VARHAGNAALAASTAVATSVLLDMATRPMTSPVHGEITSADFPLVTNDPLMKLLQSRTVLKRSTNMVSSFCLWMAFFVCLETLFIRYY